MTTLCDRADVPAQAVGPPTRAWASGPCRRPKLGCFPAWTATVSQLASVHRGFGACIAVAKFNVSKFS